MNSLWTIRFLAALFLVTLLCSCRSIDSSKRMSRKTPTLVEIKADDVIFSPSISRDVISTVAARIQKNTLKKLAQNGIKTLRVQEVGQNTAKLIVEITALEVKADGKSATFLLGESTVRMDIMALKFNVCILSPTGETLLNYDEYKQKESLDDLAQIVAKDATKSLGRCYR